MTDFVKRHARDQGGYTLIELLVASAIGLIVMSGLTSVVLSSFRAASIATSRVEASGQIRSFQLDAYTDFAGSSLPTPSGCGTETNRCTTQAISLQGLQSGNTTIPSPASYKVTYTWNSAKFMLDRKVGSMEARHSIGRRFMVMQRWPGKFCVIIRRWNWPYPDPPSRRPCYSHPPAHAVHGPQATSRRPKDHRF